MTDEKVTIQDCRDAGFCIANGVRPMCGALGLDFRKLVKEGLPLADIEKIDDVKVRRAVEIARRRIAKNGR